MNVPTAPLVHAIIPLAVLEAMRSLDLPAPDGGEYYAELVRRRLGMSLTVAKQIDRYAALAEKDARVAAEEAVQLLRLAGRRADAALVFADAGRRAATLAVARVGAPSRLLRRALPGALGNRVGCALALRAIRSIFDLDVRRDGDAVVAETAHPPSVSATANGTACGLYGSAVAAVLRALTDFDGAVLHDECRARGGPACRWRTAAPNGA